MRKCVDWLVCSALAIPGLALADAPQAPKGGYGPVVNVRFDIADAGCADSCVATMARGKAPNQYYVCYPEDMVGPRPVKLCQAMFKDAESGVVKSMLGRSIMVSAKSIPGQSDHFRIVGGTLMPTPAELAQREREKQAQSGSGNGGSSGNMSWDRWMEMTGNKAKVAPAIPDSAVSVTGDGPGSVAQVKAACQRLVNQTGPNKPGIGAIYAIKYLPQVDGSSVYGSRGPQVKLTPVKLFAKYRDGENQYTNAYLSKDAFGEMKCFSAD